MNVVDKILSEATHKYLTIEDGYPGKAKGNLLAWLG